MTLGGAQCGFCTPGILMMAKALLDENPDPTDAEIRFGIAGNICRCTGYTKIIEAIQDAAAEHAREEAERRSNAIRRRRHERQAHRHAGEGDRRRAVCRRPRACPACCTAR